MERKSKSKVKYYQVPYEDSDLDDGLRGKTVRMVTCSKPSLFKRLLEKCRKSFEK